jgi:hypothetical protein
MTFLFSFVYDILGSHALHSCGVVLIFPFLPSGEISLWEAA